MTGTAGGGALLTQEEGGSTEALNKRHREPALSNSYIKQTNQPLLATHRPNLFTRTLKVFSDGLGLFVC